MTTNMDTSDGTPTKSSSKYSIPVKMNELEVRRTELSYITSVNKSTRTFFAQLCKFTNEELDQFNAMMKDHCIKISPNKESKVTKVHNGEVICAKYPEDDGWYRALVLSRDKDKRICSVLFVDYGNLETVSYKDLLRVSPAELSIMERAPFGISCFLTGSENYSKEKSEHFLDCLAQNYVMIKVLERQTKLQWTVDIPRHAYNIPFWLLFKPELAKTKVNKSDDDVVDVERFGEKLVAHRAPGDPPQEAQASSATQSLASPPS